jgi:hypothetical protein
MEAAITGFLSVREKTALAAAAAAAAAAATAQRRRDLREAQRRMMNAVTSGTDFGRALS